MAIPGRNAKFSLADDISIAMTIATFESLRRSANEFIEVKLAAQIMMVHKLLVRNRRHAHDSAQQGKPPYNAMGSL